MSKLINYYKVYTDDKGKRIEDIFESGLDIHCLWENSVNAFQQYNCSVNIIVIYGDMRVILAKEESENVYKFQQYYLSGMDGKILSIPENTWFGIQNLNSSKCFYIFDPLDINFEEKQMTSKIFNWHPMS